MEDGIKLILQKHAQKDVIEDLIEVAYKVHLNVYFKGYTGYYLMLLSKNPNKVKYKRYTYDFFIKIQKG